MRALGIGVTLLVALTAPAAPQGKGKDKVLKIYGVESDFEKFPQTTPEEALRSVVRALEEKQIDYLLAFLADPDFVKARLKLYRADLPAALSEENKDVLAFGRLVKATTEHFREDPTKARELYRFWKDHKWADPGGESLVEVESSAIPTRKVFLKKVQDRWHLLDRDK